MKEITRIHIAKVPYEIETSAKKELEAYTQALESYGIEAEIVEDIEIRMTEILAERDVKKGDVVSAADVKAVKKQLGEPRDFMGDGDIAVGPSGEDADSDMSHKLYRDLDNAVVGGVLSGIAAFFKINPVWIRLLFIVVVLASGGTAILVYIVLWIAVPPARTAADKLQMAGRAVTVSSIRMLNENEVTKPPSRKSDGRRVAITLAGVVCIFGALMAACITIVAALAMILSGRQRLSEVVVHSNYLFPAYILAIVSGLLLVVLFILGAYMSFTQKITRRVLISLCIVVVLGLASFGTAVVLTQLGGLQVSKDIQANTRETALSLPADSDKATALLVDAEQIHVKYIVSSDTPTGTLRAIAKDAASMPEVAVSLENNTLKLHAKTSAGYDCLPRLGCGDQPTVVVYGPALTQLTANEDSSVEYQMADQKDMTLTAQKNANISVSSGIVQSLTISTADEAKVTVEEATVQHLTATVKTSSEVEAGTVQTLTLNDQESSCPSRVRETRISVWRIASDTMTVNGTVRPAKTTDSGCVEVTIESKENL